MLTSSVRRNILERRRNVREREKASNSPISKHLQKVYPLAMHKSNSSCSLSSLSLSQYSNDSSFDASFCLWDRKIQLSFYGFGSGSGSFEKRETPAEDIDKPSSDSKDGNVKRCHWITKGSDQIYISFHDEQWGVPVYDDDNQLFELLTLSGMLMDLNWTEILRKRELYREAFSGFEANFVAKMEEKEIIEISSNKKVMLTESRVRCIVDNAKCIVKIVKEFGSLSNYLWGYMNYKPMINRYRYPRNVPLRTPKSEAISKDLVRRGFRYVGPVITYSFMQAAGMTIDHLVDCFRFDECVGLSRRSWAHC